MITKHTSQSAEIHAQTAAHVGRKIAELDERRRQITNQRAASYASALKTGTTSGTQLVDADERAAREHAKVLLNGSAPESLSLPPEVSLDRALAREQRGIDIALKILNDKNVVVRAAQAVEWGEANADEWRKIARDIVLVAVRLEALDKRARDFLATSPDLTAVNLGMHVLTHGWSAFEIPVADLKAAALKEGFVSKSEIGKAENVE